MRRVSVVGTTVAARPSFARDLACALDAERIELDISIGVELDRAPIEILCARPTPRLRASDGCRRQLFEGETDCVAARRPLVWLDYPFRSCCFVCCAESSIAHSPARRS